MVDLKTGSHVVVMMAPFRLVVVGIVEKGVVDEPQQHSLSPVAPMTNYARKDVQRLPLLPQHCVWELYGTSLPECSHSADDASSDLERSVLTHRLRRRPKSHSSGTSWWKGMDRDEGGGQRSIGMCVRKEVMGM
jgi:hypothetical protein